MKGIWGLVLLALGGCRAPMQQAAVIDCQAPVVRAIVGTEAQLSAVAELAGDVERAESLSQRLPETPNPLGRLLREQYVRGVARHLDLRRRRLQSSAVTTSELVLVSMRADVDQPLDELLLSLGRD